MYNSLKQYQITDENSLEDILQNEKRLNKIISDINTFQENLSSLQLTKHESIEDNKIKLEIMDKILKKYSDFGNGTIEGYNFSIKREYDRLVYNTWINITEHTILTRSSACIPHTMRYYIIKAIYTIFPCFLDVEGRDCHRILNEYLQGNHEDLELFRRVVECSDNIFRQDESAFDDYYDMTNEEIDNVIVSWHLYFKMLCYFMNIEYNTIF